MYDAVKEKEDILKNHPKFREWVEAAVERHLTAVVEQQQKEEGESPKIGGIPTRVDCSGHEILNTTMNN
eukprot:1768906-Ditylum_brightwellii.AAC.1